MRQAHSFRDEIDPRTQELARRRVERRYQARPAEKDEERWPLIYTLPAIAIGMLMAYVALALWLLG